MTVETATRSSMYCRRCRQDLAGLSEHRCSTCGARFNPNNARTYRRLPRRRVGAVEIISLLLVLLGAAGWLHYSGWLTALFGP